MNGIEGQVELIQYGFGSQLESIKFGFNSSIKLLEDDKYREEDKIIFFFMEKGIEILLDMLTLKVKSNKKTKLFVIDKHFK